MKVKKIKAVNTRQPVTVADCFVDKGYLQGTGGALPDVDIDYQSDRRAEIKEYIEKRYNKNGKQQVFSAGTFTTLKVKAVLKDVARTKRIPVHLVNYLTAIFDDDKCDFTGIFKLAAQNRKIARFIEDYPDLFEDIRTLMFQPRSASIHASALLVTPDEKDGESVECFDFVPIKKVDGVLVSEQDGYELDELGLLKNDCLATKELSKLQATMNICNREYGTDFSLESIATSELDDDKTYKLLAQGFTQNVFQFSSRGMTKFLVDMKPACINDLIAANALYRPATLENGSTEAYIDCKGGLVAPTYLWGTYNALKDTYGQLCIAEGSLIKTRTGLKRIEDVQEGELVQTENGSYHCVTASMYKGLKDTVTVRTTHGIELTCTTDHKVLTQYGWCEAGKLIPKKHSIKGFWLSDENLPVGDMKDWCLGIYLANGTWGSTPTITCRNRQDADIIAQIFNQAFDLQCSIYFNTRAWYVSTTYRPKNNKPNPFKEYLKSNKLENKKSYDKFVPHMSLMLLSGFIEGDGCLANGRIRIKNRKLAYRLIECLQAFRIPSSLHTTIELNDIVYNIAFNGDGMLRLHIKPHKILLRNGGARIPSTYLQTVNMDVLDKSARSNIRSQIKRDTYCYLENAIKHGAIIDHDVWGVVLSVNKNTPKLTYDLTINQTHSFVTGGLVTHNCYQEQVVLIARKVGDFSLGDGVRLVKYISKKKTDKIQAMKSKFMEGAKKNGCPQEDAVAIWKQIEACGSYIFNKSHATAYAVTSYVGAYLKANYPTAFYTVALQWADDDELVTLIGEMEACSKAKVVPPDINVSEAKFYTDYSTDSIFWSLTRIKQVGTKAVEWIVEERDKNGDFSSIVNFIDRVFKYKLKKYEYWDDPDDDDEVKRCPVNARHVLHLILAGCFDRIEKAGSVIERYAILEKAAGRLGFEIKEKDIPAEMKGKHYFWSQQQVKVSGIGAIDYKRVYDNSDVKESIKGKASYTTLQGIAPLEEEGKKVAVCATVVEVEEKKFKNKKSGDTETFCKMVLQQNNDTCECVVWPEEYAENRGKLLNAKGKLIIFSAMVKYSDYTGKNNLQFTKKSIVEIL
ncbi:MAG: DNA polymerase III subunit alpha [Prevotella sp.]|jgi:hypothetical protein|nr:DNA polymerase III subunit alpha [Prevotella sp.]